MASRGIINITGPCRGWVLRQASLILVTLKRLHCTGKGTEQGASRSSYLVAGQGGGSGFL